METRSNHILVGIVTLILLAILAGFTIWLARLGGGETKEYDIFFKQSVNGLANGSGVTFAGIPSGQVQEITLWKQDPEFVRVRIKLNSEVPVLQGTTATIAGVGFTGVSQIQLDGAVKGAPAIDAAGPGPGQVPVIPTKPGALGELLNSAPLLVQRLATLTDRVTLLLSDENQESINGLLKNSNKISASLAKTAPDIGKTMEEFRLTLQNLNATSEQITKLAARADNLLAKDGGQLIANLKNAAESANSSMKTLDQAVQDARPGLQAFSNQTLPEAGQLVRDLQQMTNAMTAVAERLDQGGAGALLGAPALPDYKPK